MAMQTHAPKTRPAWIWGGAAAAAIVVIAALGFGVDWTGDATADAVAPAIEQADPVSE